jgi:hypothetical protein
VSRAIAERFCGALGAVATVTVVVRVVVPFAFVAVNVYVVVEVGFTVVDPMRVDVEKEPGVIARDVALVTFQDSVDVPAEATIVGDAVKEEMTGVMPESVVDEARLEEAETFPTLSCAETE